MAVLVVVVPLPLPALLVTLVVRRSIFITAIFVIVLRALLLGLVILVAFAISHLIEAVLGIVGMRLRLLLPLLLVVPVLPLILPLRHRGDWLRNTERCSQKRHGRETGKC